MTDDRNNCRRPPCGRCVCHLRCCRTCVAASHPHAAMETGVHHINSFSRSIQILPITALLLLILPTLLSHSLIWEVVDFSLTVEGGGRLAG